MRLTLHRQQGSGKYMCEEGCTDPKPTRGARVRLQTTAFEIAQRFVGVRELDKGDHPLIQWWLSLCGYSLETPDSVAWCSAFVNGITWTLRLPRSKSAAARSWLDIGLPVDAMHATAENDVVVLMRGGPGQPGPGVKNAPGHVGFFAGFDDDARRIRVLGGNQSDSVSVESYPMERVLGIRRLA